MRTPPVSGAVGAQCSSPPGCEDPIEFGGDGRRSGGKNHSVRGEVGGSGSAADAALPKLAQKQRLSCVCRSELLAMSNRRIELIWWRRDTLEGHCRVTSPDFPQIGTPFRSARSNRCTDFDRVFAKNCTTTLPFHCARNRRRAHAIRPLPFDFPLRGCFGRRLQAPP